MDDAVFEKFTEVIASGGTPESIAPVVLPADELAHDHPIEWWYFTGHLSDRGGSGRRVAFELTVVRLCIARVPVLDYAFFSFIEPGAIGRTPYLAADRFAPFAYSQANGLFRFEFGAPAAQPGVWTIAAEPAASPAAQAAAPTYFLDAAFEVGREQRAIRLTVGPDVKSINPPSEPTVLHGAKGVVEFIDTEMGYYTRPRLKARGGVKIDGDLFEVDGYTWLDHEWGPANFVDRRWKFFAIQADDLSELIVYQVGRRDGSKVQLPVGIYVDPSGVPTVLQPPTITETGAPWGPGYPLRHRLDLVLNGTPTSLEVVAEIDDQRRIPTGRPAVPLLTWWEGVCRVTKNGAAYGAAFMELGGYE